MALNKTIEELKKSVSDQNLPSAAPLLEDIADVQQFSPFSARLELPEYGVC